MQTELKTCTKCCKAKPATEFYKYMRMCKTCHAAKCRAYYAANKEKCRERIKRYRAANLRERGYHQKWRAANQEKLKVASLFYRYGLTPDTRNQLLESQSGKCGLCPKQTALGIDHDHETGRIRGLLCRGCNTALGRLGDNEAGLRAALVYINRTIDMPDLARKEGRKRRRGDK